MTAQTSVIDDGAGSRLRLGFQEIMMQIAVQKHGWIAIGLAVLAVATQLGQTRVFAQTFAHRATASCSGGGGGITLPKGFCATIFADNIGHARQLVVAPDGTVFVNTWSGVGNDKPSF